jgi:hypothetical protein
MPTNMVYNFSMRRGGAVLLILLALILIKSCADPSGDAKETVEEFLERIREGEGIEAVRLLHPSFRDSLVEKVKLPVQFTELKPSELLACVLTTMGHSIEDVEVDGSEVVGEKTALVKVKIEDKDEIEKIFTFVVMRDTDRWYIVDITSFVPQRK